MTRDTHRTLWRTLAAVTVAALLASTARAQTVQSDAEDLSKLSLEDLMKVRVEEVFGASKRLQPATEAPSSVSIVTATDIERFGYRSLAEILRSVRGLYVTNDRNYSYLGARGFAQPGDYNTRVLLLVDGHRVNDDVYDQAGIGAELGLDPATFQRVEIIRGPSSALYGTSAFFAVVNITTKRGADLQGFSAGLERGTFDTRRAFGMAGRTFDNGLDVAFSATREVSDGPHDLYYPEYDAPESNGGHAIDLDSERMRGVSGRLSFKDLSIVGAYGWRRKVVPTAAFDTLFNAKGFDTIDERAFVDASYEHTWRETKYSLRGYADKYNYDATYPYAPLTPGLPTVTQIDYGHGVWWGADVRVTRTLPGAQTLVAGAEFRDYVQQDQGMSYSDHRTAAFTTNVSTNVFAGYVQDEVRLRDRVLVSLGGRYDAYSGFGQFSPRASVVFAATPKRSFKYLLGRAFRAPNAYEFDYLTNGVRNYALRSETLTTTEVAWEEYVGTWLRTSVSVYANRVNRLITLTSDDDGALMYGNACRVLARGFELEGEFKAANGVQTLASYAWQRGEDRDKRSELVNSPAHLAKFRVSGRGATKRSTLAFEIQAMSSRLLLDGGSASAHATADLRYVQPVNARLNITVSVRNMFGTIYSDPASEEHLQEAIPQDGRTVRVGLQWAWSQKK